MEKDSAVNCCHTTGRVYGLAKRRKCHLFLLPTTEYRTTATICRLLDTAATFRLRSGNGSADACTFCSFRGPALAANVICTPVSGALLVFEQEPTTWKANCSTLSAVDTSQCQRRQGEQTACA